MCVTGGARGCSSAGWVWIASQVGRPVSAPPPSSRGSAPPGWTRPHSPDSARGSAHARRLRRAHCLLGRRAPLPLAVPSPPLFSPPLDPSSSSPPRPAARSAQFRPTAWHPSASAVCLGLGESNQERRLQFSGRAVRGASSLLFIHQQRDADPGLALSRRLPRPLSAPGSTLRRSRSPCAALIRGSAASSFACSPFSTPFHPYQSRAPWPPAFGPFPGRDRLRGCLPRPLLESCSGSQVPGTPRTNFWCLFLSPKCLSARSLISELSQRKGAGAGSQAGRETSFLLSCPGLCVGINFSVVISDEPKRFRKAARRRPARLHFASFPTPSKSPCHSSCSPLWGGLSSGAVSRPPPCAPPSFSLRSAPPRYVRFRNGLAFPRLGMTVGWAGVARPA